MKKPLLALLVGMIFLPATSTLAETINYDGSDTSMLQVNPNNPVPPPNSLYPSITSLSGNIVNVTGGGSLGATYGAVTLGSSDVTGNTVNFSNASSAVIYGGYTLSGNAINNTIVFNSGNILDVYGGYTDTGNTIGNTVTLDGGSIHLRVYGGYTDTFGIAKGNTVNINNATVSTEVHGGSVENGEAIGNTVNLNGGDASNSDIIGGFADNGMTSGNAVNVNAGSARNVYGGNSDTTGNSINNIVNISGGTITGNIIGGLSESANANGNTVNVTGGTIANVTGGVSAGAGTATGNTVSLVAGTISGSVWGGSSASGDAFTGNTLNVSSRFTFNDLKNFQNLNFNLPGDIQTNDPVITVTSADLGGASKVGSINMAAGNGNLAVGDTVTLIRSGSTIGGSLASDKAQGTKGLALLYDWDLQLNNGNSDLTATLAGASANPQSHALLMGRSSELALLRQGGDLLSGQALENMIASAKTGNRGFFAMQGGHSRYKAGSHFDLDSFTGLVGAAWGNKFNATTDVNAGVFFEAGTGSYDSHNSFTNLASVKSDGDTHYYGAGVMGEINFNNGFSADAAFRAGRVKSDLKTDIYADGQRASYDDTSSTYYGAHITGAYKWAINQQDSLNTYARYSWTHVNSNNATVLGDNFLFDSADSHRVRVGTKYARTSSAFMPYAGVAYEYEFDGKSKGSVYGYDIKDADLGGGSFVGELGFSWLPTNKDNLRLNVALEGFAGKREGVMGSFRLDYRF